MSHLPVDTVLGGTGGALQVERGLHLLVPELFPRAPTEPLSACACLAGNVKARCTFSTGAGPRGSFPKGTGTQPMTSYRFPDALPATSWWHLGTLHPVGHTSPSMRPEPQLLVLPSLEMYWPLFMVNQSHY